MILYVLGIVTSPENDVLLIRKTKPEWQAGRLNGIGGKIEPAESPAFAMAREFYEETGCGILDARNWDLRIRLTHPNRDSLVFFYHAWMPRHRMQSCVNTEGKGELIVVKLIRDALIDVSLMNNLRWMIPMFLDESIQSWPFDMIYSE